MIHDIISIPALGTDDTAKFYTYFLDNYEDIDPDRRRPLILLCPGGGYEFTSDREAEPVAMQFLAAGFHVGILRYSVYPALYPVALSQLACTVAHLRANADRWHIDPDRIIVQGCSAGGHLAASYAAFWKKKQFLAEGLGVPAEQLRPNGLLLCYPVITSGKYTHEGSMVHLLGEEKAELREEMSLENQVCEDVPPTFLWHTFTDESVPVQNSLLFYQALVEKGIPSELHIYPHGIHGLSLANEETRYKDGRAIQKECQSWVRLAIDWINSGKEA